MPDPRAMEITEFWKSVGQKGWFEKSDELDRQIVERFAGIHAEAADGKLDDWKQDPDTCLALILLLDQFSRNMYRDDARSFAQDERARDAARYAVDHDYHLTGNRDLAFFFIMPFIHSESIVDQARCVSLMHGLAASMVRFAHLHRDVIERFGRFPYRNQALERHSTMAEREFLKSRG